jgi:hypothetical protein
VLKRSPLIAALGVRLVLEGKLSLSHVYQTCLEVLQTKYTGAISKPTDDLRAFRCSNFDAGERLHGVLHFALVRHNPILRESFQISRRVNIKPW